MKISNSVALRAVRGRQFFEEFALFAKSETKCQFTETESVLFRLETILYVLSTFK